MGFFKLRLRVVFLSLYLLGLVFVPSGAEALDLIRCESHGRDYQYCRARTRNRVVLVRRLSDAPCSYNRTWGYDNRGVWVAEGCRAEFEVGKGRRPRPNSGNDWNWEGDPYSNNDSKKDDGGLSDGAVAAIALGALVGGALLGSAFSSSDVSSPPPLPSSSPQAGVYSPDTSTKTPYYYEDYRYGSDYERGRVPNWLVGRYSGYSTLYRGQLEMSVFPDGSLQIRSGGTTDQGYYRDGEIVMQGRRYRVSPDGRDVKAVDSENPKNELILSRIQ